MQAYTATVGGPLPLLEARLASVPEMGYDALAAPPRGELLIRGPVVFQGYYRDEAATREARSPWTFSLIRESCRCQTDRCLVVQALKRAK